jgi:pimeloyl-ACP methyl ester carboxylesterase
MLDSEAVNHLRAAAEAANLGQLEVVASEQYDVPLGEMRVHVLDWGGSGEPVVLLHGGGLTAHTWDLVCLGLRPTYHCIAPDLRGHGDTSWSPERRYTMADHRADLEGLIAHLGLDRFVLVGMSLGGAVAMNYAGHHPDKLTALVLVDVGPEMSGGGRERLRSFAAESQRLESVDAYVERAMAFNPRRKPELLRRSLLHNLRRDSDGMWAWKYDPRRMGPAGSDTERHPDVMWSAIERIDCPTLVVRGADSDLFLEQDAAKLVSRLRRPQFVQIAGAGHTVQGDQPGALTAALQDFLEESFSGQARL